MPKDNENVPLPVWTTEAPEDSAPAPFAPDQMVRCDECLRANPPTRVNCLYCGAVLPHDETTVALKKPALRPLEKWEQGYNNILLPPVANLTAADLVEASDLLRLRAEDLGRILASATSLPLARAATIDARRAAAAAPRPARRSGSRAGPKGRPDAPRGGFAETRRPG